MDIKKIRSNTTLCSIHFERSQFMNDLNTSLITSGVPILSDIPHPPPP